MSLNLYESAENYLETILILQKKNGTVRSIDIVNELGYSKPSISVAMKNLRQSNYIKMDGAGLITLTPSGLKVAEKMLERHNFLTGWLKGLGVPEDIAAADACRIEHVLSRESFEALKTRVASDTEAHPPSQTK